MGRDTVRGPGIRARAVTTDQLLDLAYDAQDVVASLREIHDPLVAPRTYVYALIEALSDQLARRGETPSARAGAAHPDG